MKVPKVGVYGKNIWSAYLVSNTDDVKRLEVKPDKLSYVIKQHCLSMIRDVINALQERFPKIVGPDVKDIVCNTNRQSAVRDLVRVDLVLVVGAEIV